MKLAFLISGRPRTFVFREQIEHFKKLKTTFPEADFFILLRLPEFKKDKIKKFKHGNPYIEHNVQTIQGLKNLEEQLDNLKPVYYHSFTNFQDTSPKECRYTVQWRMIDKLLKEAEKYSIQNNFKYSYFIRYRFDWTDLNLHIDNEYISNLDTSYIYKNLKDCEDVLFILPELLYQNWWKKNICEKLKIKEKKNDSFLKIVILLKQLICLMEDY